ncbi:MAG: RNA helicase [Acidimicrobiales bacterium]|nr:MAG: RNA helicase [Acidimicrobiales bacterium]
MAARRPQLSPAHISSPAEPSIGASFADLGVPAPLVRGLSRLGITSPFPIQEATLPHSLAGRDVLGRGRTGSGKTYAFVLPMLARLAQSQTSRRPGRPRALILAPTRELASQIEASIAPLAAELALTTMTVFGGVGANPQIRALQKGVDVLVACPGRLADHITSGYANLDSVEITVLDEADHMADLGFLPVVKRLLDQTPRSGQRMLFSATLDAGVDVLVRRYLSNPATHSVDSAQSPIAVMSHHVLHVLHENRLPVLVDLAAAPGRTIMFTRTKRGATRLARQLVSAGVAAVELHGNLAQNARTRNLLAFSNGSAQTLVATDIAARGIHVDDVALVIHADPPVEHKAYLHRSGRTARAGASGTVITLATNEQMADVRDLARKAGITPTTTQLSPGHPLLAQLAPGERCFTAQLPATRPAQPPARNGGDRRGGPRTGARHASQRVETGNRNGRASSTRASSTHASAPRSQAATPAPSRRSSAAAFSSGARVDRQRFKD